MHWINSLERRFGHLAVPGLVRIIVAFNTLVYLLLAMKPGFIEMIDMRPGRIMAGEVWRLVSYIFIPQVDARAQLGPLWAFFYLSFLWIMGEGLEQAWGSFRLNLYYLIGMAGTTVAAFFFGDGDATGVYLNLSLLFAFATLFPDFPFLLFFFLPVRIKWLALFFFFLVVLLPLVTGGLGTQLTILVALLNYVLFFASAWVRHWREHGKVAVRQQKFQLAKRVDDEETLHRCKTCSRTELDGTDLDFRVAEDGEEYCLAHLPSRQGQVPPPLPQVEEHSGS